jgi:hypothetical protein
VDGPSAGVKCAAGLTCVRQNNFYWEVRAAAVLPLVHLESARLQSLRGQRDLVLPTWIGMHFKKTLATIGTESEVGPCLQAYYMQPA